VSIVSHSSTAAQVAKALRVEPPNYRPAGRGREMNSWLCRRDSVVRADGPVALVPDGSGTSSCPAVIGWAAVG